MEFDVADVFSGNLPLDSIEIVGHEPPDAIGIGAILQRQRPKSKVSAHFCLCHAVEGITKKESDFARLIVAWYNGRNDCKTINRLVRKITEIDSTPPVLFLSGDGRSDLPRRTHELEPVFPVRYPFRELIDQFTDFAELKEGDKIQRYYDLKKVLDLGRSSRPERPLLYKVTDVIGDINSHNWKYFLREGRKLIKHLAEKLEFPNWIDAPLSVLDARAERAVKAVITRLKPINRRRRGKPWIFVTEDREVFALLCQIDQSREREALPRKMGVPVKELVIISPSHYECEELSYQIWAADRDTLVRVESDLRKHGLYSNSGRIAPESVGKAIPVIREAVMEV